MRTSKIVRNTQETKIDLELNLDGGEFLIDTKIGFLNHMLELFAKHSNMGLKLSCKGDLDVDFHHTVEDIGICLGKAIKEALLDKVGIARYASTTIPMDESLASVSIDLSGRAFLVFNADFKGKCGEFDLELIKEFFQAVASFGGITLHINLLYGENNHHKAEAIFKAFAHAVKDACSIVSDKLLSSKGVLE